jgi:hypothetical protein
MRTTRQSEQGRALSARRTCIAAPVPGLSQQARGLRQVLLRGVPAVPGEVTRVALRQKLRKRWRVRMTTARACSTGPGPPGAMTRPLPPRPLADRPGAEPGRRAAATARTRRARSGTFVPDRLLESSPHVARSAQILKKRSRNARIASRSPLSDPPWMRWKQVSTKSLGSNDRVAGIEPGSAVS